jgi:hypothetical protein
VAAVDGPADDVGGQFRATARAARRRRCTRPQVVPSRSRAPVPDRRYGVRPCDRHGRARGRCSPRPGTPRRSRGRGRCPAAALGTRNAFSRRMCPPVCPTVHSGRGRSPPLAQRRRVVRARAGAARATTRARSRARAERRRALRPCRSARHREPRGARPAPERRAPPGRRRDLRGRGQRPRSARSRA